MMDATGNPQRLLLLGGTSDIALATAERFAADRSGLEVVLAARPTGRREQAAQRLSQHGCRVVEVDFDAADEATHESTIATAFDGGDVDVAVVAFGVLGDQELAWQDVATAASMVQVNYAAAVVCGVRLAAAMRTQGHGMIVALSSVAAERPRRSNFVYGSTKAGFDAFYTGLGEALRPHGVTVVVVRPGFVRSRMTEGLSEAPLSQSPEQVASVIVDAVRRRRETVWAPGSMRFVMSALRHLPRPVFRRLPI